MKAERAAEGAERTADGGRGTGDGGHDAAWPARAAHDSISTRHPGVLDAAVCCALKPASGKASRGNWRLQLPWIFWVCSAPSRRAARAQKSKSVRTRQARAQLDFGGRR